MSRYLIDTNILVGLVAHALVGTPQKTSEELASAPSPEQSATRKLIANWRSVFEESLFSVRPV